MSLKSNKKRIQRLKGWFAGFPLALPFSKSPGDWIRGWAGNTPLARRLGRSRPARTQARIADAADGLTSSSDRTGRVKMRIADIPVARQLSKERIDQVKARIANSPLARNRVVVLTWRVIQQLGRDDATHLAAGVAYYAFFSLFPLLLGLLAIAGMILGSEGIQRQFLDFITDYLPGSAQLVENNVEAVVQFRGALGAIAIIGLLWSASAVFGAISRAVNRAWGIRQNRPFYIAKPRQIGMALAVGLLFFLSTGLTSAIELLTHSDLGVPGQQFLLELGLGSLVLRIIPWLMTFAIFLMLYRFVPNTQTYWRYVWPGAIVAAVLFEAAKSLFVLYLNTFANYDQVYGNLASVMILLFWTFISAIILILGAEISSEYERMMKSNSHDAAADSPDGPDPGSSSPESLGG